MKKIIFAALAIALLLSGCQSAAPGNDPASITDSDTTSGTGAQIETVSVNAVLEAQPIVALDDTFVSGVNAFGLDTAALLYSEEKNLSLSPVSIALALAMTRTGAAGDTADEIKSALGLDGMSDEDITAACKSLMWRANTGGMEAANALWLGDTYTFRDAFLNTCTQDFMTDALPLTIPGATDAINAWASEKTHGRITELMTQELPPETEIVLTNALYFLGDWAIPFEANDTHDAEFSAPAGSVTVPFMHNMIYIPYYQNDDFEMISLDFTSDADAGQYAMAFLLPKDDMAAMLASAGGDVFSQALNGLEKKNVQISLPKFEYDFFTSLKDTLMALGMTGAFTEAADFSPMTIEPNGLVIEDVLHKCYIRVDELGAEAAAVTEVVSAGHSSGAAGGHRRIQRRPAVPVRDLLKRRRHDRVYGLGQQSGGRISDMLKEKIMRKILLSILGLVLLLAGCSLSAPVQSNADLAAQEIAPLDESFVHGINTFGFNAARLLYDSEKNMALSPVSIEMALAMTRTGTSGQTADEMKQALGLNGLSDDEIISMCKSLMWRANTGGMEAANAIWLGSKYTFQSDFLDTCTKDFMADARPLEIPGAMKNINAWAHEKTHGRIDKILTEEPSEDTQIVLTNALYFLGEWEMPFKANNTRDGEFDTPNGAVTVPFMFSDRYVPYYQGNGFSMVSLDFQSQDGEGQYAMAFLLPEEGAEVSDMLSETTGDTFSAALDGMESRQVWIKLPKFEYTFFTPLNDTLKALGMPLCFDPNNADFSAMTEELNQLYISHVLHKCYIRIDELGAEAAAVTEVESTDSAAPEDPPKFYADRPFLFAIYSREDGTIAFMGTVNDPTAE